MTRRDHDPRRGAKVSRRERQDRRGDQSLQEETVNFRAVEDELGVAREPLRRQAELAAGSVIAAHHHGRTSRRTHLAALRVLDVTRDALRGLDDDEVVHRPGTGAHRTPQPGRAETYPGSPEEDAELRDRTAAFALAVGPSE